MKEESSGRRVYVAPKLIRHGSFSELTLASQNGQQLDQTFPAGTPRGDLTFS
jgi:hypothetical protein